MNIQALSAISGGSRTSGGMGPVRGIFVLYSLIRVGMDRSKYANLLPDIDLDGKDVFETEDSAAEATALVSSVKTS